MSDVLCAGPVSSATRQAEFAKMLASLIKRISVRGQIQVLLRSTFAACCWALDA